MVKRAKERDGKKCVKCAKERDGKKCERERDG